jgi:co-chaperonin GroES (HSP10)
MIMILPPAPKPITFEFTQELKEWQEELAQGTFNQPGNTQTLEQKRENATASGIVIEGIAGLGDSKTGKVIAVGPEVTEVKVGDTVLLLWNKASVVTIDGAQRVIIKEEDIVAVLED